MGIGDEIQKTARRAEKMFGEKWFAYGMKTHFGLLFFVGAYESDRDAFVEGVDPATGEAVRRQNRPHLRRAAARFIGRSFDEAFAAAAAQRGTR